MMKHLWVACPAFLPTEQDPKEKVRKSNLMSQTLGHALIWKSTKSWVVWKYANCCLNGLVFQAVVILQGSPKTAELSFLRRQEQLNTRATYWESFRRGEITTDARVTCNKIMSVRKVSSSIIMAKVPGWLDHPWVGQEIICRIHLIQRSLPAQDGDIGEGIELFWTLIQPWPCNRVCWNLVKK